MSNRHYLRLIPGLSETGPKCTMFSICDATGCQLITGNRWGDDYMVVDGKETFDIVKALLEESSFPFEEVEDLPNYHKWAENQPQNKPEKIKL